MNSRSLVAGMQTLTAPRGDGGRARKSRVAASHLLEIGGGDEPDETRQRPQQPAQGEPQGAEEQQRPPLRQRPQVHPPAAPPCVQRGRLQRENPVLVWSQSRHKGLVCGWSVPYIRPRMHKNAATPPPVAGAPAAVPPSSGVAESEKGGRYKQRGDTYSGYGVQALLEYTERQSHIMRWIAIYRQTPV